MTSENEGIAARVEKLEVVVSLMLDEGIGKPTFFAKAWRAALGMLLLAVSAFITGGLALVAAYFLHDVYRSGF